MEYGPINDDRSDAQAVPALPGQVRPGPDKE